MSVISCNILQSTKKINTNLSTLKLRSKQTFKIKDIISASLYSVHSLKVFKLNKKLLSELFRDDIKLLLTSSTHWSKREHSLNLLLTLSIGRKVMQ